MLKKGRYSYGDFVEVIPFLGLVPKDISEKFNTSEFFYPDFQINIVRELLEMKLNCHVMTYKTNYNQNSSLYPFQLCKMVAPAQLNEDELCLIKNLEKQHKISLVAYKEPFTLTSSF